MTQGIHYYPVMFAVDEKPFCVWDTDPESHNRALINNYNPGYFVSLRRVYMESATEENKHEVALALRLAYAHGLEALFSLLGATLQVPHYVPGWLLSYQVKDVKSIVGKIQNRDPIKSFFTWPLSSWLEVSRLVHFAAEESESSEQTKRRFADLWAGLARDFIEIEKEYNSIKHGFRAIPGGMEFSFRPGGADGPPESEGESPGWIKLGSSEFGSRFFYTEKVDGLRHHWRLKERQHNWHPRDMLHGLTLIAVSLNNIICFLKLQNRISDTVTYKAPTEEELFTAPWRERPGIGVTSMDINMGTLTADDVTKYTKEQILSVYPSEEEE